MIEEENLKLELEANAGWDERIRVAKCGELVRSYLVKASKFVLVYDTLLGPSSGTWLREQALEFGQGRPLVVVNSHADWDHYFGNMCFPEPIIGTAECARRVKNGVGEAERQMKLAEHPEHYRNIELVAPSILVDSATLAGGDLSFTLIKTVGHRPDHLALYIPELETLLPGDCVEDPIPLVDEDSQPGDQTVAELADSLDCMQKLKPSWVLANHAAPENGTQRLLSNLGYLRELQAAAQDAPTLEALKAAKAPDPAWGGFYQEAHQNQLRMAWEQRVPQG